MSLSLLISTIEKEVDKTEKKLLKQQQNQTVF